MDDIKSYRHSGLVFRGCGLDEAECYECPECPDDDDDFQPPAGREE